MEKKETTEEMRLRLSRTLVQYGINPDEEKPKQLQSEDKLIKTCEKRVAEIAMLKEAIAKLKPNKADIAEEAGLSRTSISKSHSISLLKIYNSFFPEIQEDTVPIEEYNKLKQENKELKDKLDGYAITQARLINALDTKKKLINKTQLQGESIKNLTAIINDLKQKYLMVTGEELNIDVEKLTRKNTEEEENLTRKIQIPFINSSGVQS